MRNQYIIDYTAVIVAGIVAVAIVTVLFFLAWILAPRQPSDSKGQVYECGMLPIGQYWSQVHVRYYLFAILFMIFDVEAVFLFPWAVVLSKVGQLAFYEMILFIAILFYGIIYAWRKGILEWK